MFGNTVYVHLTFLARQHSHIDNFKGTVFLKWETSNLPIASVEFARVKDHCDYPCLNNLGAVYIVSMCPANNRSEIDAGTSFNLNPLEVFCG